MDTSKSDWKVLSHELKYDNPWISLTEFKVITPGGSEGIYGKVHFKNLAIGIIPMDADGNIYLVGQYRFVLDKYSIEIPEGGGHLEIDPLESAKRELKEETGMEAARWENILQMHLSNSVTDEFSLVYLARDLTLGESSPEETESLTVMKLPLEEVYKMVNDFIITDSMTVAAILKLWILFKENKL